MRTNTLAKMRNALNDSRFRSDAPVYVRIVQPGRSDPDGSWHADELPITGGLTGWHDDHVTLLCESPPTIDAQHLERQIEWSERTFGPNRRTLGIADHIRKELKEVEDAPEDPREWIDIAILALDGAWRAGMTPQQIIDALHAKQRENERRQWPDWRTIGDNVAIEHVRP